MQANPKIGDLLVQAGLVDPQQIETALAYQKSRGGKLGEILVSLNYLSELDLLETLSRKLGLDLLSEAAVLDAEIPTEARGALPRFLQEEELIFPLAVDRDRAELTVVTHEPLDDPTLEGIRIFANVREVKTYLTTKAAMRKLLAKHLATEPGISSSSVPRPLEPMPPPPPPPQAPRPASEASQPGETLEGLVQNPPPAPPAAEEATGWDVRREGAGDPSARVIPLRAEARPPAEEEPVAESDVVTITDVGPAPAAEPAPTAVPPPPTSGLVRRVLIVDSDEAFRTAIAAALESEGHRVYHVGEPADVREIAGSGFDDLVVRDPGAPEVRLLAEDLRRQNPFLEVRTLPALGPVLFGWTVDPARQFQFFLDMLDVALRMIGPDVSEERRRARARAEIARDLAGEVGLPVKSVEEIYLGSFLQGLDDLLRRAGLDGEGAAPTRALLERTACPYQVDDLLDPPPEIPPREGEAPTRARIAAVAAAYIASDPPAEQSIRDAIRRLPWAYEVPDLAGALLRVLARRGDLTLPEPVPGREVVIVDSDTRAAGILWLRFVSEGTAVRVFADGASALDYLQQGGAGLVISEVDLPALSGLDLCAALRADPQTGRLKFFFVSREADPQVIMRGLSSGADDYLIKPVNVELLLIKAKRALAV